jgi:hypothetical protein
METRHRGSGAAREKANVPGGSDAASETLHPGTPSICPAATSPSSGLQPRQRSRTVSGRGAAEGSWGGLWRLFGRSRRWKATSRHAPSHPWGQPTRTNPMTPRHSLFAKCLSMHRWGSYMVHRLGGRALPRVQTEGQIETRWQSPASFRGVSTAKDPDASPPTTPKAA